MMKTIRLNAIIYPSNIVCDEVISLSTDCHDFAEIDFRVDGQTYFPHITLYFPSYPIDVLPKIKETLREVALLVPKFVLKFKDITFEKDDGGIFINYEQNKEVLELKEQIIDVLNPIRDGLIRKKYKDDASKDVIEFGYPIYKYHFPHITVTSFRDNKDAEKFIKENNKRVFSDVIVDTIALGEMGEHGTCTNIIEKFRLKN